MSALLRTRAWSLVLPLKPLDMAKSRLGDLPAPLRQALVVGMALDVRDAVLGCREITEVVVVSRDPRWRTVLGRPGMRFVADAPEDSLNDALRRGAAECRRRNPGQGIAALPADLPALRAGELRAALRRASAGTVSFVPDARGDGTTLLAARLPAHFDPRFGDRSRVRHLEAGARELDLPRSSGLRQDVDTLDDLADVQTLRLGQHTRAVLAAVLTSEAGAEAPRDLGASVWSPLLGDHRMSSTAAATAPARVSVPSTKLTTARVVQ